MKTTLTLLLLALALAASWWSARGLERLGTAAGVQEEWLLPAKFASALSLNYKTFLADLAWVRVQLHWAQMRQERSARGAQTLLDQGRRVAELDPNFEAIYPWVNAVYINSIIPASHAQLNAATDFMVTNAQLARNPGERYYQAALNYIGYSRDRAPKVRAAEFERAISLLNKAALYPRAPRNTPQLTGYFYRRLRELKSDAAPSAAQEIDFYKQAYTFASDEASRTYILQELRALDAPEADIEALKQAQTLDLTDQKLWRHPYLPDDLWLAAHTPQEASP